MTSRKFLFREVGILIMMFASGCHQKPDKILLTEYVLEQKLTTNLDSAEIRQVVDSLVTETKWSGKIHINKAYEPNAVNVYIIDGSKSYTKEDEQTGLLVSNCAYIGYNIIFLDDAYLRSFLDNHRVKKMRYQDSTRDEQQCFLYWAIGHELGHLVCGHTTGEFVQGSLDHFVKTSSLDNKEELEADSFFVHAIIANQILRASEESLMMSILNAEIERKIGKVKTYGVGIIYDYTNEHVVSYARQPTHPEYVIRLSRILELCAKMSGDSGFYNLVSGFIKQLKEVK